MKNNLVLTAVAVLIAATCGLTINCMPATTTQDQVDNTGQGGAKTGRSTQPQQASNAKQKGKKASAQQQATVAQPPAGAVFPGSLILGRPTADSISLSLLTPSVLEAYVEYGKSPGTYSQRTGIFKLEKEQPLEIGISSLEKDTQYYYRTCYRAAGSADYTAGAEAAFHTQRAPGSTFSFGVQGDSHPERLNNMFNPDLYGVTMNNAASRKPDFYFTLGDDFSIEHLIDKNQLSQQAVDGVYSSQRPFLGIPGSSAALFLVNGNHEQAARYLLDGSANSAAVLAGKSRLKYFPLPTPGPFYSVDSEQVEYVGLPADYYAWTWGDALFVVIDPYWHSPVPVDNVAGGGEKRKDTWEVTLGTVQYEWFRKTLESSNAKYKFVFAHHVNGTGRGGTELAGQYEWGGRNGQGAWEFNTRRPGWEMPIHQLMAESGVSIFFQGHDHLFARQELDGVVYQSVPNPADPTYQAVNSSAYGTGKVLPNSGFLNVTVSNGGVQVDYIGSCLSKEELAARVNGKVVYSYTVQE